MGLEIALFDTETTGLLKPSPAGLDKQPEIIELYACIVDEEFNILREYESFYQIKNPLPEVITKITGITDDMLIGEPFFIDEYNNLAKFFTGVDMIVAHNLEFDTSMLANELIRIDKLIKFPWPRYHCCTVEASMKIKGYRLKLIDLYDIMVGGTFDAHRAKNDVKALTDCFRGMVGKGIINLDNL